MLPLGWNSVHTHFLTSRGTQNSKRRPARGATAVSPQPSHKRQSNVPCRIISLSVACDTEEGAAHRRDYWHRVRARQRISMACRVMACHGLESEFRIRLATPKISLRREFLIFRRRRRSSSSRQHRGGIVARAGRRKRRPAASARRRSRVRASKDDDDEDDYK